MVNRRLEAALTGSQDGHRYTRRNAWGPVLWLAPMSGPASELLGKRPVVTIIAGEVVHLAVEMEEVMAFGTKLLQLGAAALRDNDVTGIAIGAFNFPLPILGLVQ